MKGRALVGGVLTAPLVTGALVAFTPAAAVADSGDITSPSRGAVVTGGSSVLIAADAELAEGVELRLRGPSDDSFSTLDKGMGGELRYRLDISCPDYNRACAGHRPAANGAYTVRVVESGALTDGDVEDHQAFTLRIPPASPDDVSIRATGTDSVRLHWDSGDEPDLVAYGVTDAAGEQVKRVPAGAACNEGACSTRVRVRDEQRGGQVSYAIRSYRRAGPASGRTLASEPSAGVSADLPAGPRSQARHTGGGSRGGFETGYEAAAAPVAARRLAGGEATSDGFRQVSSRYPVPEAGGATARRTFGYPLPPLPTPTPAPRPHPDGVQAPALAPVQGEPPRSMTSTIGMGPSEWWKTVAVGLVLLLVAAHIGAWTWRTHPEPPRGKATGRRRAGAPATSLAAREATRPKDPS